MRSTAAATRYARALFDVVLKETPANVEKALADVQGFADLFTQNAVLAGVLGNPAIPAAKKRAVAQALLERAGAIAPPVAKVILLLAEKDRLALVPDIAKAYRERLMDHLNIVRGEVTTAVPLADDKLRVLEQGLAKATGRKVVLESRVDASIIGGAVTRLGSTVYDGSITTQLEKMKQALIEAGQ
jgi:F-type H+-transporting ATPase subunit delta